MCYSIRVPAATNYSKKKWCLPAINIRIGSPPPDFTLTNDTLTNGGTRVLFRLISKSSPRPPPRLPFLLISKVTAAAAVATAAATAAAWCKFGRRKWPLFYLFTAAVSSPPPRPCHSMINSITFLEICSRRFIGRLLYCCY